MKQTILLIEKNGIIKENHSNDVVRDLLYKKCGFKKKDDFEKRHTWSINMYDIHSIELWARSIGKAGQENKYELPSPLSSTTYFGTIALVFLDDKENICSATKEQWSKIYDFLFEEEQVSESEEQQSEDEINYVKESLNCDISDCDETDDETIILSRKVANNINNEDDETNIKLLTEGLELEEEEYNFD